MRLRGSRRSALLALIAPRRAGRRAKGFPRKVAAGGESAGGLGPRGNRWWGSLVGVGNPLRTLAQPRCRSVLGLLTKLARFPNCPHGDGRISPVRKTIGDARAHMGPQW